MQLNFLDDIERDIERLWNFVIISSTSIASSSLLLSLSLSLSILGMLFRVGENRDEKWAFGGDLRRFEDVYRDIVRRD